MIRGGLLLTEEPAVGLLHVLGEKMHLPSIRCVLPESHAWRKLVYGTKSERMDDPCPRLKPRRWDCSSDIEATAHPDGMLSSGPAVQIARLARKQVQPHDESGNALAPQPSGTRPTTAIYHHAIFRPAWVLLEREDSQRDGANARWESASARMVLRRRFKAHSVSRHEARMRERRASIRTRGLEKTPQPRHCVGGSLCLRTSDPKLRWKRQRVNVDIELLVTLATNAFNSRSVHRVQCPPRPGTMDPTESPPPHQLQV